VGVTSQRHCASLEGVVSIPGGGRTSRRPTVTDAPAMPDPAVRRA